MTEPEHDHDAPMPAMQSEHERILNGRSDRGNLKFRFWTWDPENAVYENSNFIPTTVHHGEYIDYLRENWGVPRPITHDMVNDPTSVLLEAVLPPRERLPIYADIIWHKLQILLLHDPPRQLELITKEGIDPHHALHHLQVLMAHPEIPRSHLRSALIWLMHIWLVDAEVDGHYWVEEELWTISRHLSDDFVVGGGHDHGTHGHA